MADRYNLLRMANELLAKITSLLLDFLVSSATSISGKIYSQSSVKPISSYVIDSVMPDLYSFLVLKTDTRADPEPSSISFLAKTPTVVVFPEPWFPMTAILTSLGSLSSV